MTGKKSESIGLDTDAIMKRLFSISGARNERELADVLGVTRATLNYAKLREALPYKHIVKAALLYGRSVDWILWGEESSGAFVAVPMYEARLSADGRLEPCASAKRYAFRAEWLSALCKHNRPQDLGLMRVSGDSMLPAINDGDAVLLDFAQTACRPGQIYAVAIEGLVYLRRIDSVPGEIILQAANAEPLRVHPDDASIQIVGRCVWLCRKL